MLFGGRLLGLMVRACGQNLFRICGDFAHLFSFFILFFKIYQTKQVGGALASHPPLYPAPVRRWQSIVWLIDRLSTAGISLKTQILYVIVFCSRYIDLLWNFASMYNWFMKVRAPH